MSEIDIERERFMDTYIYTYIHICTNTYRSRS